MTAKQLTGAFAPDGSKYVTLTDGAGNLATSGGGLTIGSTAITGGATTQVLFNNAGVLGSDAGLTKVSGATGAVTFGGQILPIAGGATNPSINWGTNTGIFGTSGATVQIAINGSLNTFFASTGLNLNAVNLLMNATNTISWSGGAFFTSPASAVFRFGATDNGTPIAQTLRVQNVLVGTSNTAGVNFTIAGSQSTGTGLGGSLVFQTSLAGTTGTAVNALVTGLTVKNGSAILSNYTVAGLPPAATSGSGGMAFVTDATQTAIAGLGLTVVGGGANKVVVYSDGTNWLIL